MSVLDYCWKSISMGKCISIRWLKKHEIEKSRWFLGEVMPFGHSPLAKSTWPSETNMASYVNVSFFLGQIIMTLWMPINMAPMVECLPYTTISLGHSPLSKSTWFHGWMYHSPTSQINMIPWENVFPILKKHQHSLFKRETFYITPSLSLKYTKFDLDRGLVRISTIFSSMDM